LGLFSACLLLSSITSCCSLLLRPSVGHLQATVPQQYLLPRLHPQPHHHNIPFHKSSLLLSQTCLRRSASQPLPHRLRVSHITGPSLWCQSWPEQAVATSGQPLSSCGPVCNTAGHAQLPGVKFHAGQKAGAQPTPPAQLEVGRRVLSAKLPCVCRGAVVSVQPKSTWYSRADGQTWRNDAVFRHIPLLQK